MAGDRIMFSVIKCHRCGRVFVHFGIKKTLHCTNHDCHTMITRSSDTVYPIEYPECEPYAIPVADRRGKAYIYITSFNNVVSLTVAVFSTDGNYAIFIPISGEKLPITNTDLLKSIPKHWWSTDPDTNKITVSSGIYPVIRSLQNKLETTG
jgi:hypothetical protein